MSALEPYAPLNEPKRLDENVWLVDGPEIGMRYGPLTLPFTTRMTVARLRSGDLWLHSPIAPDARLFAALDALGPVRHLVAPSTLHYWYMTDWIDRYPEAATYAVPDLATKAKRGFRIDRVLDPSRSLPWQDEIDWVLVAGSVVSEAVFHLREPRVTILVDLIENFEPDRIHRRLIRWLVRLGRANGHTPIDFRLTFRPNRAQVARAVQQVLAWPTDKLVIAHGKPFAARGGEVLRRELAWAVKGIDG
jgi:hypothetical protein